MSELRGRQSHVHPSWQDQDSLWGWGGAVMGAKGAQRSRAPTGARGARHFPITSFPVLTLGQKTSFCSNRRWHRALELSKKCLRGFTRENKRKKKAIPPDLICSAACAGFLTALWETPFPL